MNSYLRMAEAVLKASRQPLTAREILDAAYRNQMVPPHLFGKTQHKTLQARLSEELLRNKLQTVFIRTGPGRFGLRSRSDERNAGGNEYVAPLRSYQLKQFSVLCADRAELDDLWGRHTILSPFRDIAKAFQRTLPLQDAEGDLSLVHLQILVTIRCLDRIMTIATHASSADLIGRSFGLFGYLKGSDADLFSKEPLGVDEAARRTIAEQSSAPADLIDGLEESITFNSLHCLRFADPNELNQSVVLLTAYECGYPEEFIRHLPRHRAPRWTHFPNEVNDINNFDSISRQLAGEQTFLTAFTRVPPR